MADQHDACDEVRKWRRSCQQKPCGFAAALGRRKSVAHNSTGPTSVSIDLEIRKGSWGSAGGSIEATEQAWLGKRSTSLGTFAGEATHFILFVAQQKPSRGGICHPSVMQFYSGPLMHFLSGVDRSRPDATSESFQAITSCSVTDAAFQAIISSSVTERTRCR